MTVKDIKLAVVGSRNFVNYRLVKETILQNVDINRIKYLISGGAVGADSLAQQFAKEHGLPILIFYPDWNIGKHAGFLRNERIIKASNLVYAFQVDKSKGTQHSINLAKQFNREVHVINI